VKRLAAEGNLDPRLTWHNSVWLAQDEIDLLAEAAPAVVLNPQGNLKMKCGIPPIRALQEAGVRIGLGCDNCSCSDAQNMFVAMKLYALLAAVSDPIPGPPQAVNALQAATEAGAEGARLGHAIGRIAPGYKADLTLIDMSDRAGHRSTARCGSSCMWKPAAACATSSSTAPWWCATAASPPWTRRKSTRRSKR